MCIVYGVVSVRLCDSSNRSTHTGRSAGLPEPVTAAMEGLERPKVKMKTDDGSEETTEEIERQSMTHSKARARG